MSEANYVPNAKQLEILRLFYRFRFLTSTHLVILLNLKHANPNQIHQRLKVLLDNKLIDRHYSDQYKIDRRPAEYFLLKDGVAALKQYVGDKCDSKVLHSIYSDKGTKPKPIAQYLRVCTIYCYLKQCYGDDNLKFFTKSQIRSYSYFPKRRPEALIRLDVDGKQKEFFLEVIDPNKPLFDYVGKVRRYIEYSDDGTWREKTGRKLPTILFIGDTVGTEYGTLYTIKEVKAIADWCHAHDMYLHMDGCRLPNAVVALNTDLLTATRDAGVDVLCFGGAKNGLMNAEAVVIFNAPEQSLPRVQKQVLQLSSKMRYVSAQFIPYLTNDLWRKSADHANTLAQRLADGFSKIDGIALTQKLETNQVFVSMPDEMKEKLHAAGHQFYDWDAAKHEVRFVTAWDNTTEDVDKLLKDART